MTMSLAGRSSTGHTLRGPQEKVVGSTPWTYTDAWAVKSGRGRIEVEIEVTIDPVQGPPAGGGVPGSLGHQSARPKVALWPQRGRHLMCVVRGTVMNRHPVFWTPGGHLDADVGLQPARIDPSELLHFPPTST
jgi:hypothetical protein